MNTNFVGLGGARIYVKGIVQGVGFRPFVFGLAKQLDLRGWVRNTSAGVEIEVDGDLENLQVFINSLRTDAPPLSQIDEILVDEKRSNGFQNFEIIESAPVADAFQPISPDVSICDDCLRELFNPNDRRYLYPFINCTNCGPRFTIIEDLPYDRQFTTMAGFRMCPECEAEYQDPLNRRFHAQPIACPSCGPHAWLEIEGQKIDPSKSIQMAIELLRGGKILAIKGLGGFHLACDATNPMAVNELRSKKLRVDKPFAIMMRDIETVREHCLMTSFEVELLLSKERPVVILPRRLDSIIDPNVAPKQDTIGVILPYTPLHYLLFSDRLNIQDNPGSRDQYSPLILVMTSGNLSEEPIVTNNEEAIERLGGIADAFLFHNRPIYTRCDDSVVRTIGIHKSSGAREGSDNDNGRFLVPIRRSRGYVPFPVYLGWERPPILAVGGELKNVFCMTRRKYAFMSHHIGDLENFETLNSFENGINHFEKLFRVSPEMIAYDRHPNYLATRYALNRSETDNLPAIGVQHHHAHIAACMAENHLALGEEVLGVAFDGTGYGDDGAIWGGEFLQAGYRSYKRLAHLKYIPLLGGDKAILEPWRIALAWLDAAGIEWEDDLPPVSYARNSPIPQLDPGSGIDRLSIIRNQLARRINSPLTSSVGRLFDAVASLIGIRQTVNYEAQAAIELEAISDKLEGSCYSYEIIDNVANDEKSTARYIIDPGPIFQSIVQDKRAGLSQPIIAAKFHNTLAAMIKEMSLLLCQLTGWSTIALSGGVWQNMTLFEKAVEELQEQNLQVIFHRQVPCNDGGLALGQAAVASWQSSTG